MIASRLGISPVLYSEQETDANDRILVSVSARSARIQMIHVLSPSARPYAFIDTLPLLLLPPLCRLILVVFVGRVTYYLVFPPLRERGRT